MNYPSVKIIETRLGIDRTKAKTVRQLMTGELAADSFESVRKWLDQCHNRPSADELIMKAIDEVIGGYGVEVIDTENSERPEYVDAYHRYFVASYVNMGDTYDMTVLLEHRTGRYIVCSWGGYVESKRY